VRALRLLGPRQMDVTEIPPPAAVAPDEVLVRVEAVGICGTDLHYYRGESAGYDRIPAGFVMGHEFAGRVEAVGSAVSELRRGDRVALDPAIACERCEACRHGHQHVCPHGRFVGAPPMPGALCDLLVHPARLAFPLGDRLSAVHGALLEPLGVALHAVDLGGLRIADTVAVLGAGPLGLLIAQLARLGGAREVFVTDVLDYRLDAARRQGVSAALNATRQDPVAAILEATAGRGVDVAFEVAGAADTPEQAAAVTRVLGTVVIVGICADDRMTFRATPSRRKGLTLKVARRMSHVYPRTIALVERGMVQLDTLVSHVVPLANGPAAFRTLADYEDDALKVVVVSG
jgi:L-iditol 2-dehydrogenase